jgi:hypothetical protein
MLTRIGQSLSGPAAGSSPRVAAAQSAASSSMAD